MNRQINEGVTIIMSITLTVSFMIVLAIYPIMLYIMYKNMFLYFFYILVIPAEILLFKQLMNIILS
jgi:hypothetical protein